MSHKGKKSKLTTKQYKQKMKKKYKETKPKSKFVIVNPFPKIPDELLMLIFSLFDIRCSGMCHRYDCNDDEDCCECCEHKSIKRENFHNARRCEIRNLINVCKRFQVLLDTIEPI